MPVVAIAFKDPEGCVRGLDMAGFQIDIPVSILLFSIHPGLVGSVG